MKLRTGPFVCTNNGGLCVYRKVRLSFYVCMLEAINVGNYHIGCSGQLCPTISKTNFLIQDANSVKQIHSSVLFPLYIRSPLMCSPATVQDQHGCNLLHYATFGPVIQTPTKLRITHYYLLHYTDTSVRTIATMTADATTVGSQQTVSTQSKESSKKQLAGNSASNTHCSHMYSSQNVIGIMEKE